MSGVLGWAVTAAGGALVLVALRDIFRTIWYPGARGGLTRVLMTGVFRTGGHRRGRRWLLQLAGPLAMVAVVFSWLALIIAGFALVYWPHLPESFLYGTGLDPGPRAGFSDALYLSAVTLGTLGFGDIVPVALWLRIAVPVQSLIGFALLTAAVSWVLEVYPALARRRSFAVRLAHLDRVGTAGLVRRGGSALAPVLLTELAGTLAQLRADLGQYAETFYFRDGDREASLPATFAIALDLAELACRSGERDLAYAGELLQASAEDYLRVLDVLFLDVGGSPRDICAAYADAHGHGHGGSTPA